MANTVQLYEARLPQINRRHRVKMERLETAIKTELRQVDLKEEHLYARGTYTRILHIPKGTAITGKIHRHACINILSKGKIAVVTDEGTYALEAPAHFVSGPGVKKAGYALEDSIWVNVHPWDGAEDLHLIEDAIIIPGYEALEREIRMALEDNTQ